ncbi:Putative zinc- or iron-chelating domain containing protein [uncultured Caudovirales phage]|uniref:Zinc- or iron-chelating domain containing protein n=1 Tax=uncultured Caudovirales phage TaxID=2100421 RepID=A0A6J5KVX2_9CAUD|nr:Putative zinc- or iron-chelating domain containing protein [uncultured Caudovirales phage]
MKYKTVSFKGIIIENDQPISDVPCGDCVKCCSGLSPYLTEAEFASGKYMYTFYRVGDADKPVIAIPRAKDGACMYLVNSRCSIYEDRPYACRQFDCRNPESGHPKIPNQFK